MCMAFPYPLKAFHLIVFPISNLFFLDETRQIGSLICRAIEVIDCQLENDFEQRLKYYTNCRADFKRLDSVLFRLIHMSMNLALLVRRTVNQSRAKGFMQVLNNEHTALLAGLAYYSSLHTAVFFQNSMHNDVISKFRHA